MHTAEFTLVRMEWYMFKNAVIKFNTANLDGRLGMKIEATRDIASLSVTVTESTGRNFTAEYKNCGKTFGEVMQIDSPLIWSVSHPNLYGYKAVVTYADGFSEEAEGKLGFRTLSHDEHNVMLNGEHIYIKGYIRGATAHEHPNLLGVSDKEYFRKNIETAKKFGFNLIRFHSVVPSEELFEIADEVGMLVHIELRMPNDEYNNLEEMLFSKKDLIPDEFILKTVNKLYNHPSLAVYCIGNEIKNLAEGTRVLEIGNLIKKSDPTRLYLDTCAWGEAGRPLVDIDVQHMGYYFPYGSHADTFSDTDNLLVVGNADHALVSEGKNSKVSRVINHKVPLIAHEVCHYTALRDFAALKKKFEEHGQPLPWWIDEELKLIESKGHKDNFEELFRASKHFQYICWKTAFENMRASDLLGGFHFLQFADTERYENSNGVVDCFDDATYTKPEDFRDFNGDDVLLSDIKNRIIEGEILKTTISLSRYSELTDKTAKLEYTLSCGKEIFCQGELDGIDISKRDLYRIAKLSLHLPALSEVSELTLCVKLTAESGTVAENRWQLWFFPKTEKISYSDFTNYEKDGVAITDSIEKAFEKLAEEKKVCLVYRSAWTRHLLDKQMPAPEYAFRATWNRFKPVIWDRGTNFGGLCDSEILSEYGFKTGRFYDFNYSIVSEDCDKIILDDFPVKPKILLSGTDKSSRDRFDAYAVSFNLPELMPDRTLRSFGYLFELKVGKGSLLVCGLNMTGLDRNEPSTLSMAHFIMNYLKSADFAPTAEISAEDFKAYMKKCAEKPVKERMMTQYWELDDAPVESKQYWIDSRAYLTE